LWIATGNGGKRLVFWYLGPTDSEVSFTIKSDYASHRKAASTATSFQKQHNKRETQTDFV